MWKQMKSETLARRLRLGGREGPGRRLRGREAGRAHVSQPYKDFKSAQPSGMWLGPGGGAGTPVPRWPSGRPAPLVGLRGEGERLRVRKGWNPNFWDVQHVSSGFL